MGLAAEGPSSAQEKSWLPIARLYLLSDGFESVQGFQNRIR